MDIMNVKEQTEKIEDIGVVPHPFNYLPHNEKIKLFQSFDFIILSLGKDKDQLTRILTHIYTYSTSTSYSKRFKSEIKTYNIVFNGKQYKITYIYFYKGTNVWIRVDDPDVPFLEYLSTVIDPLTYRVVQIEFTFDFTWIDMNRLFSELRSRYQLAYSSRANQLSLYYPDTSYSNNIRTTKSKGLRLYKKRDKDGTIKSIRMEIVYKKNLLKKLNVYTIEDAITVDNSDVYKYLQFKRFDWDIFIKNYVKRMEKGDINCQLHINEVTEKIRYYINKEEVNKADKYAKQFISYSCFDTDLFEYALKAELQNDKFLSGKVVEIHPYFLFDQFMIQYLTPEWEAGR